MPLADRCEEQVLRGIVHLLGNLSEHRFFEDPLCRKAFAAQGLEQIFSSLLNGV